MSVVSIQAAVARRVEEEKSRSAHKDNSGKKSGGGNGSDVPLKFVWECYRANEVGDSELYNYKSRGKFAHNNVSKRWLKFVGPHWIQDNDGQALAGIEKTVIPEYLRLLEEQEAKIRKADQTGEGDIKKMAKEKARILARIEKLRSVTGRKSCLSCAVSNSSPLTVAPAQLDQHPLLLPVANGVVDMRTGELRPGRPDDWLTMAAPTEWKGLNEPCPEFEKFVRASLDNNEEKYEYLHRALGYAASGSSKERIFLVLYGQYGSNGKSTLMNKVFEVLGDLCGPIQSEMLLTSTIQKSGSGPSPEILGLKGKRAVWASEVEENAKFAVGKIKNLTGNEPLTGRGINDKDFTTFHPTHTLFLILNHKPYAPANDNAFFERLRIIDFPLSFVNRALEKPYERPADLQLEEKLAREHSGILAWLLRGYLKYVEHGLAAQKCVIEASKEYRRNEDVLQDWIDENCELDPGLETEFKYLYQNYQAWWEASGGGRRGLTKKKFGILLKEKFDAIKTGGVMKYLGLGLRLSAD
ncbi:DNA primase family protein [Desulfogranum japonicum]|uniref:DNA primase family protein n=1 Tax=Desulfogranum japonicum TaxID=231447 RepID=UPI0004000FE4|nr:phage/plasmid primase, P4 family [Desulfogranum japonicum]